MNPDYILYTFFNVVGSVCPHNCDECVCAQGFPKMWSWPLLLLTLVFLKRSVAAKCSVEEAKWDTFTTNEVIQNSQKSAHLAPSHLLHHLLFVLAVASSVYHACFTLLWISGRKPTAHMDICSQWIPLGCFFLCCHPRTDFLAVDS